MDQNEFFFRLTPELVLEAAEQAGFATTGHCLALNSLENRVYDVRLEDATHVVVKFYRPGRWTREQIEEEHRFLFDLQAEEIPVCAPLPFPDGGSLRESAGIHFAVWPRTGGRAPDELSDEQLAVLGRLLARIHNVGAAGTAQHRLHLNETTYGEIPLRLLLDGDFLPQHCRSRYEDAARATMEAYRMLSAGHPAHRIHGDCHLGNLLHGDQGYFFLDFDDFLNGPPVQDLWLLLSARDPEGLRQRSVFLEAYRQFREFDTAWLSLIEPLRALRYIHYAAWVARRYEDPAFPNAFPHFGSDEYWEKETADLADQVALFGRENPEVLSGALLGGEGEAELTNADIFWDWEEPPRDS